MQRNEEGSSRSCCHANILELQQLWSNIGSIYLNISTTNGSYNKQWYTYIQWVRDVLLVLLYVRQDASSFLGPMLLTMVNSNSNPFYSHVWTLVPECICYFIHYKMWDEITPPPYPSPPPPPASPAPQPPPPPPPPPNFNGATEF